jgi:hypothetical protein
MFGRNQKSKVIADGLLEASLLISLHSWKVYDHCENKIPSNRSSNFINLC